MKLSQLYLIENAAKKLEFVKNRLNQLNAANDNRLISPSQVDDYAQLILTCDPQYYKDSKAKIRKPGEPERDKPEEFKKVPYVDAILRFLENSGVGVARFFNFYPPASIRSAIQAYLHTLRFGAPNKLSTVNTMEELYDLITQSESSLASEKTPESEAERLGFKDVVYESSRYKIVKIDKFLSASEAGYKPEDMDITDKKNKTPQEILKAQNSKLQTHACMLGSTWCVQHKNTFIGTYSPPIFYLVYRRVGGDYTKLFLIHLKSNQFKDMTDARALGADIYDVHAKIPIKVPEARQFTLEMLNAKDKNDFAKSFSEHIASTKGDFSSILALDRNTQNYMHGDIVNQFLDNGIYVRDSIAKGLVDPNRLQELLKTQYIEFNSIADLRNVCLSDNDIDKSRYIDRYVELVLKENKYQLAVHVSNKNDAEKFLLFKNGKSIIPNVGRFIDQLCIATLKDDISYLKGAMFRQISEVYPAFKISSDYIKQHKEIWLAPSNIANIFLSSDKNSFNHKNLMPGLKLSTDDAKTIASIVLKTFRGSDAVGNFLNDRSFMDLIPQADLESLLLKSGDAISIWHYISNIKKSKWAEAEVILKKNPKIFGMYEDTFLLSSDNEAERAYKMCTSKLKLGQDCEDEEMLPILDDLNLAIQFASAYMGRWAPLEDRLIALASNNDKEPLRSYLKNMHIPRNSRTGQKLYALAE